MERFRDLGNLFRAGEYSYNLCHDLILLAKDFANDSKISDVEFYELLRRINPRIEYSSNKLNMLNKFIPWIQSQCTFYEKSKKVSFSPEAALSRIKLYGGFDPQTYKQLTRMRQYLFSSEVDPAEKIAQDKMLEKEIRHQQTMLEDITGIPVRNMREMLRLWPLTQDNASLVRALANSLTLFASLKSDIDWDLVIPGLIALEPYSEVIWSIAEHKRANKFPTPEEFIDNLLPRSHFLGNMYKVCYRSYQAVVRDREQAVVCLQGLLQLSDLFMALPDPVQTNLINAINGLFSTDYYVNPELAYLLYLLIQNAERIDEVYDLFL